MKTNRTEEKQVWKTKMRGFVNSVAALTPEQKQELSRHMSITTCEGHSLSPFNECFLSFQTPIRLTIIGGFRQWKKSGRTVCPGQHAAGYIYVPIGTRKDDELTEEDIHFRLVPVFDISQTENLDDAKRETNINFVQELRMEQTA